MSRGAHLSVTFLHQGPCVRTPYPPGAQVVRPPPHVLSLLPCTLVYSSGRQLLSEERHPKCSPKPFIAGRLTHLLPMHRTTEPSLKKSLRREPLEADLAIIPFWPRVPPRGPPLPVTFWSRLRIHGLLQVTVFLVGSLTSTSTIPLLTLRYG
jgi:hypothetical protein